MQKSKLLIKEMDQFDILTKMFIDKDPNKIEEDQYYQEYLISKERGSYSRHKNSSMNNSNMGGENEERVSQSER
jgi:hypothetical protein